MLGRVISPLHLTWSSRFFSRKLKGPTSQRFIRPTDVIKQKAKEEEEKQRVKITTSFKNMYVGG